MSNTNSDKPNSIGKRKGGFLFASASDLSINVSKLQEEVPEPQFDPTGKANDSNSSMLSGSLKERLSQYRDLKEEEQRTAALAAAQPVTLVNTPPPDPPSPSELQSTERPASIEETPDESWVPKVEEPDTDIDVVNTSTENSVAEEGERELDPHSSYTNDEEYEEEEIIENEQEFTEQVVDDEDSFADAGEDEDISFEEVDTESSRSKNEEDQDVFRALDDLERAESMYSSQRMGASQPNTGTNFRNEDEPSPNNRELSQGALGNSVPSMVSSQREVNDKSVANGSPEKNEGSRSKLNCIIIGLVFIACVAIVAIILPFVIDYRPKTSSNPEPPSSPSSPPSPVDPVDPVPPPSVTKRPESIKPTNSPTDSPTVTPTTLQWRQFMKTFLIPVSGEEVFQDKKSPQYRAAEYILDDPYTAQLTTTEQLDDRYASATFYFATEGENWDSCYLGDANCTNGQWLASDVCDWFAVSCNDDGRVTSFSFANAEGNGLVGSLPFEMYLLSDMTDLIIVNNTITGTLPEAFGENATSMRSLLLPDNELTGKIPDSYLSNSPLEFVHLGSNGFSGLIPSNIGNTTYLQQLDLSGNSITGRISDNIGGYTALEALSIANNKLKGTIPEEMYGLTNLKFLHMNGNELKGTLSTSIGDLLSLKEFRIGESELSGYIPDELYTLTSLVELDISRAQFDGRLSLGLLNLENLEKLIVNDNKLVGTVPNSFGRMSALSEFLMQGNELSGTVPDSVCLLREDNLEVLTADCKELTCDCCSTCF